MLTRAFLFGLTLIAAAGGTAFAQSAPVSVKSPDGQIVLSFETVQQPGGSEETGQLVYSVSYRGKPLVTQSALRLELAGARPLGADVQIVKQTASQADSTYRLVTGKASVVRNHYNAVQLQTAGDARLAARTASGGAGVR